MRKDLGQCHSGPHPLSGEGGSHERCSFAEVYQFSTFLFFSFSKAPLTQENNVNTSDGILIAPGASIIIMNLKIAELLTPVGAIMQGCVS